jgi:hypothetical protein
MNVRVSQERFTNWSYCLKNLPGGSSGIWISFGTTQRATADRPWLEATMACSTQVHLNQTLTIIGRLD